jgi:hypothetical protein
LRCGHRSRLHGALSAKARAVAIADFSYNISKGEIKKYCKLDGGANDALIVIPFEATGVEADATLKDYDDVSALLAGTTNEQTTMGRKTISSVTITVDDTNDRTDIDVADQVWAAATGNAISDLTFAYDPDTTAGTDTSLVPLTNHDFSITPDGSDVTAVINVAGFFRAS